MESTKPFAISDAAGRWKDNLHPILKEAGSTLYSAASTVTAGDFYILGTNPGGDPNDGREKGTIAYDLEQLINTPSARANAYLQSWANYEAGEAPLQTRLAWLVNRLKPGTSLESVCASNLIFAQSRNIASLHLNFNGLATLCWPIHEEILSVVQPRVIIAFGNSAQSPFGFLRQFKIGEEKSAPAGHGRYVMRAMRIELPGNLSADVLGMPHLSRFRPQQRPSAESFIDDVVRTGFN